MLAGVAMALRWRFTDGAALWLLLPPVIVSWRRHTVVTLVSLSILFFGVGLWRGSLYAAKVQQYSGLFTQKVVLMGTAAEDGSYGSREQLAFTISHVQLVSPYQTALVGVVSVSGFGASTVHRGDRVQASGRLQPTLGGNQASMSFATLQVVPRPPGFLESLRRRFGVGLQSALPEPLASFGLGLLVGQKNTLPPAVSQTLLMVGLTHVIAVSGYNLTIILQAARRILGKRSKFQTAALCVALALAFLGVAGASPSLVRAALVSGLSLAAWYYGREIRPVVLLLLAAAITVVANPLYLWGNISWYLSFLSFYGVIVLGPQITHRLFGEREPKLLLAIVIESVCAEALTLPYVLHIFGQMSLVALPANLLVVALVPLAMLLTLIAGLAGMFAAAFAGWFAWPARWLLAYMLNIAHLLSRIPHAFVQNRSLSTAEMIASYAIIGMVSLTLWRSNRRNAIITDINRHSGKEKNHERSLQMVYD